MLKIKDEIPLKELEKFGFKKAKSTVVDIYYYPIVWNYGLYIEITVNVDRTISLDVNYEDFSTEDIDVLFDLIKADMIEKVVEEDNG